MQHEKNSSGSIGSRSNTASKKLGYQVSRQAGSHIRLTTEMKGIHHITVPNHSPLKVGTLSNILKDIASHFEITKEDLVNQIF